MRSAWAPLVLLLAAAPAAAQDSSSPTSEETSTSSAHKPTSQLLSELTSSTSSDRSYAARSLRSQLMSALRLEAHGREGTIAYDDALARLVELDERLPSSATTALQYDNVVAPCAEMLAMLEVAASRDAIVAAQARVESKGAKKRIDRALACLDGTAKCPHESKADWQARVAAGE